MYISGHWAATRAGAIEPARRFHAGTSAAKRGQLVKAKQLVWKTVPIVDGNGMPKRAENPLSQYGIDVTQVLIGDPRPEQNLDRLLMDKKRLVAERIKTVQEQETSKAQAKTEQLKKEIERTKAVQDAQREKELVVIKNQREVEVAKQIAERETIEQRKLQDLAVIQKDKELAVALKEKEHLHATKLMHSCQKSKVLLHCYVTQNSMHAKGHGVEADTRRSRRRQAHNCSGVATWRRTSVVRREDADTKGSCICVRVASPGHPCCWGSERRASLAPHSSSDGGWSP